MDKLISKITLVIVIISVGVAILSVSVALYGIDQSAKSSQKIIDTVKEGDTAILEKSFADFQPELKYRIFGTSSHDREPYEIRADITNMGNEETYVKNIWTVTGEICNPDGTGRYFDYDTSFRNELNLTKGEEKSINFTISKDFFETFPDKTAFMLKLELEMNPYLPSTGPIQSREFDEMAFIQYDYNEERNNSWLVKNVFRDLDCTGEPSIHGQVFLNTSSWDFGEYGDWWKFPEE